MLVFQFDLCCLSTNYCDPSIFIVSVVPLCVQLVFSVYFLHSFLHLLIGGHMNFFQLF